MLTSSLLNHLISPAPVLRSLLLAELRCYAALQWAHQQGIDMRILSDCNSVFISHMLTGAKVNTRVQEVITNLSSFVRCQPSTNSQDSPAQSPREADSAHSDAESSTGTPDKVQSASMGAESANRSTWHTASGETAGGMVAASHRMVVQPRHDWTASSHGCPLCPANLCKVRSSPDMTTFSCMLDCACQNAAPLQGFSLPTSLCDNPGCQPSC